LKTSSVNLAPAAAVFSVLLLAGCGSTGDRVQSERDFHRASELKCAEVWAYKSKRSRAERKRLIKEAREEAVHDLAKRALSQANNITEIRSTSRIDEREGHSSGYLRYKRWRIQYEVDPRLRDGKYREEGDKNEMKVTYCVTADAFQQAKASLEEKRRKVVARAREKFARLETAIYGSRVTEASEMLALLKNEVGQNLLEQETYRSRDGRSQLFEAWLREWDALVSNPRIHVEGLLEDAKTRIKEGRLETAESLLKEALKIDPTERRAYEITNRVNERRSEFQKFIAEAERNALNHRFSAAENKLEQARAVNREATEELRRIEDLIDKQRAALFFYNPRLSFDFAMNYGNLGADFDAVFANVTRATGSVVRGDDASVGWRLGSEFRIWRNFLFSLAGNYVSHDLNSAKDDKIDSYQVSAGLGFENLLRSKNELRYQLIGGVSQNWMKVDVDNLDKSMFESSDSRLGAFVRLKIELQGVGLYYQHDFGLGDEETKANSLVDWANSSFHFGFILSTRGTFYR